MDSFNVGDIVLSKMGRDSGRLYVVMSVVDNFAYICDGDLHKVDKPKKKKFKHMEKTPGNSEYVAGKIQDGLKVTNTEIRRSILEFEERNEKL